MHHAQEICEFLELKSKVGLRGGVQLEWYKRVVPAGLNKITCGGEQTNTLSSDNEHCTEPTQGCALWVLSSLFLEHLVFLCLLHVADIVLDVCVCCVWCVHPMLCSDHTGCFTGACVQDSKGQAGVTHVVTVEYLLHFLARPSLLLRQKASSLRLVFEQTATRQANL